MLWQKNMIAMLALHHDSIVCAVASGQVPISELALRVILYVCAV
jgi:hypothetical protein